MTQVDQFQITLPSNCTIKNSQNSSLFPENRPNQYRTQLRSEIRLPGEWEVALLDIQYPYNFRNVREAIDVGVIIGESKCGKDADSKSDAFGKAVDEYCNKYAFYIKDYNYGRFKFPVGFYKSYKHISETLNQKLEDTFQRIRETSKPPRFWYNPDLDRIEFDLESQNDVDVILFAKGELFFNMLGLLPANPKWEPVEDPNQKIWFCSLSNIKLPPNPPLLETFNSMYIYSDIIEYQFVGDTQGPLLGVLPVKGVDQEQSFWTFNPPQYIPLNEKSVKEIDIRICTEAGEPFPFHPRGRVICRLHFRRKLF